MKKGQSSTPVDIPVDIFNPYNLANGLNDWGLKMSTGLSTGVDDWPCFTTFYCYDVWFLLILKLQIFPYTCLFIIYKCLSCYFYISFSLVQLLKGGDPYSAWFKILAAGVYHRCHLRLLSWNCSITEGSNMFRSFIRLVRWNQNQAYQICICL